LLPLSFTSETGDILDPQNVADGFNNYFSNVGSSLANQIGNANVCVLDSFPPSNPHSAFFEDTDSREAMKVISSLKDTMSVGIDEVPTSDIIHNYLCDLFCFFTLRA